MLILYTRPSLAAECVDHIANLLHPPLAMLVGACVQVEITLFCYETETAVVLHTTRIIFYDILHEMTVKSIGFARQLNPASYFFANTFSGCMRLRKDHQTVIKQLPLSFSPFSTKNKSPTRNSLVHFTLIDKLTFLSHTQSNKSSTRQQTCQSYQSSRGIDTTMRDVSLIVTSCDCMRTTETRVLSETLQRQTPSHHCNVEKLRTKDITPSYVSCYVK